jgi:hypothetical protein
MDLGSGRDEAQDDPFRLPGAGGVEHAESVRLQSSRGDIARDIAPTEAGNFGAPRFASAGSTAPA